MLTTYLRIILQNILDILIIYIKFGAITLILYYICEWYILCYDNNNINANNSTAINNLIDNVSNDSINNHYNGDNSLTNILQRAFGYLKFINDRATSTAIKLANKLFAFTIDLLIT